MTGAARLTDPSICSIGVGVGGWGEWRLIQLGTESVVSTSGATSFYAWYELYLPLANRYHTRKGRRHRDGFAAMHRGMHARPGPDMVTIDD